MRTIAIQVQIASPQAIPTLQGHFLLAETESDGYTGTVQGRYYYDVQVKDDEYYVYPTLWDNEKEAFVRQDEMIIYTDPEYVYYMDQLTTDPYNSAVIQPLKIEEGMDKEKRILQAFKNFVSSNFTLGVYNIFILGVDTQGNPDINKAESIDLDENSGTLLVGDEMTLKAKVTPADAVNDILFSIDDESVAELEQDLAEAKVQGLKEGTAKITVQTLDGSQEVVYTLTVQEEVNVTGVALDRSSAEMARNTKMTLNATIQPSDAQNKNVTWKSSDKSVATVDGQGEVTAIGPGNADITVETEDGGKTAICKVTVIIPVEDVNFDEGSATLDIGDEKTLGYSITPEDATNQEVSYSSSDKSVATVDNSGKVKAIAEGTATITITAKDGNGYSNCTVTVNDPTVDVTGVSLDQTENTIETGDTFKLTPSIEPPNATNKNLNWTAPNQSVAGVDQEGNVEGNSAGTADIVVQTEDGEFEARCTVHVNDPEPEPDPDPDPEPDEEA